MVNSTMYTGNRTDVYMPADFIEEKETLEQFLKENKDCLARYNHLHILTINGVCVVNKSIEEVELLATLLE